MEEKKKKENPNRIRWNPMVGQWSTIGWPLLGLWLAKGWPMVGQSFADGWVRAKFNVFSVLIELLKDIP